MRLWSLHPKYLDPQGMVALWRETLLAQAVLRGETKGYKNHPQLDRFKVCASPLAAMTLYLEAIQTEATARGYHFDGAKIKPIAADQQALAKLPMMPVNDGQMAYEWTHLLAKLKARSPTLFDQWHSLAKPEPHPLFNIQSGGIEVWEKI